MSERVPGTICGSQFDPDWVDKGTMAITRSSTPGCAGVDVSGRDAFQGAAWRTVYLLEYGGTYRQIYAAEALEVSQLKGQLPKAELERLRGQLKSKYQRITPPEVEKILRAYVGDKYDLRTPSGTSNPGKTNATINRVAGVAKYVGKVFVVVMLASEIYKIQSSDDWKRQLGASSGGLLGAVATGWVGGATAGFTLGSRVRHPLVVAGATVIGGVAGAAFGYEVFSGLFEHLYDVYTTE
jgi:hypothetical protein